jgi:hypothetical protein
VCPHAEQMTVDYARAMQLSRFGCISATLSHTSTAYAAIVGQRTSVLCFKAVHFPAVGIKLCLGWHNVAVPSFLRVLQICRSILHLWK